MANVTRGNNSAILKLFIYESLKNTHTHTSVWVELGPPKRYVDVLIIKPVRVPSFGNRIFQDVIKM